MANDTLFVHAPSSGAPRRFLPLRGKDSDGNGESAVLQSQAAGADVNGDVQLLRAFDTATDAIAEIGFERVLGTLAFGAVYNGLAWDRLREASAANVGAVAGSGAMLASQPGEWAIRHQPIAATQATITRAGVAGARHVCKSITLSLLGVAAQGPIEFFLRDGASGVGTILWSIRLQCLAGDAQTVVLSGLNIAGGAGAAMTLESGAAPAATNFASVALTGYDAT